MEIELRVITKDKYWTVYRGKKYLGAIAFSTRYGIYQATSDGQRIGEGHSLEDVVKLFNHIGNPA